MNVLIVENEKKEAAKLVRILRLVDPSITVVETVEGLPTLFAWIEKNPSPDIVLINHAKLQKLSAYNTSILAKLVLHTRQHSLTYLAFRTNAISQLQPVSKLPKPLAKGFNLDSINISNDTDFELSPAISTLFKNRFFVENGQRFLSIPVADIAYFFSDDRFVFFTTFSKNKYIIHYKMEELPTLLNPQEFYRINRSYIISVKAIDQIHPYFGSRFKLKLNPPTIEEILVSKNRAPGFRRWLGE